MVLPPYNEQRSAERGSRSCSAYTLGTKTFSEEPLRVTRFRTKQQQQLMAGEIFGGTGESELCLVLPVALSWFEASEAKSALQSPQ
jgi:hypothetical protein